MRRHSGAGGKSPNAQATKAAARKSRIAPKAGHSRHSTANLETEVARLTRERDEALVQQTATSEVLQVISSSPGDPEPVFVAMLEKAVRICGAKFGNIYRWDGDALHLVASHNTPPAYAQHRKRFPLRFNEVPEGLSRMIATREPTETDDILATIDDPRNPVLVAGIELGGYGQFCMSRW
jgi:hypothetical protein